MEKGRRSGRGADRSGSERSNTVPHTNPPKVALLHSCFDVDDDV